MPDAAPPSVGSSVGNSVASPDGEERLHVGDIVLDRAAHLVLVRGQALMLALQEFRLLELLMARADHVVGDAVQRRSGHRRRPRIAVAQEAGAVAGGQPTPAHGAGHRLRLRHRSGRLISGRRLPLDVEIVAVKAVALV